MTSHNINPAPPAQNITAMFGFFWKMSFLAISADLAPILQIGHQDIIPRGGFLGSCAKIEGPHQLMDNPLMDFGPRDFKITRP